MNIPVKQSTSSENQSEIKSENQTDLGRRELVKALGAASILSTTALAANLSPFGLIRPAEAAKISRSEMADAIKLGMGVHRSGIGVTYGNWFERTANAAINYINEKGGIAGRRVVLLAADDKTDPTTGAALMTKFVREGNVDMMFGTLFSNVVSKCAERATELKLPYFPCGETDIMHGNFSRYVFQPGVSSVRSQVKAVAPFLVKNIGKKVTVIYPDYAFGYEHRFILSDILKPLGGRVIGEIAIPPTATDFTNYFKNIPKDTDVIYHVMVGKNVLKFTKQLGKFYGGKGPQLFGFIDSLESVDIASPGLEFLDASFFWEAYPRYSGKLSTLADRDYRRYVGIDANGADTSNSKKVAPVSHMFAIWETLFVIKQAIEKSGYQKPDSSDKKKLIEAIEAMTDFPVGIEHPQGDKIFVGKYHQVFSTQYISQVQSKKLNPIHVTPITDSLYDAKIDFTKMRFVRGRLFSAKFVLTDYTDYLTVNFNNILGKSGVPFTRMTEGLTVLNSSQGVTCSARMRLIYPILPGQGFSIMTAMA